ncbi:hypothetical protein ACFLVN_04680, partial [Chloroflexota bacterium]
MIRTIMYVLILPIVFFLVTVPSLIYGISAWLLIPIGWLMRLFIGRPIFSYKAGLIALKLSTILLLLIVPTILYLYVLEPLGLIFFIWMALYLLIRIYSGVHEKEKIFIKAWKDLDALINQRGHAYTRHNLIITSITIILTVISLMLGYFYGGEAGLWI